jgi:hypothetical protein
VALAVIFALAGALGLGFRALSQRAPGTPPEEVRIAAALPAGPAPRGAGVADRAGPARFQVRQSLQPGSGRDKAVHLSALLADLDAAGALDDEPRRAQVRQAFVASANLDATEQAALDGALDRFTTALTDLASNLPNQLQLKSVPEAASTRAELLVDAAAAYQRALEDLRVVSRSSHDAQSRSLLALQLPARVRSNLLALGEFLAEASPLLDQGR